MEFANKASRIGPIPSTGSLSDRIVVSQGTRQVQSPLEVYSGLRFNEILRKEIQSKSAKLPQVPVRGPRTEPPILPPTRFNHPTEGNEGNEGKSDKKLRWEQQQWDKGKPPKG